MAKRKSTKGQTTIYKTTIVYHVTINVRETEGAIRNGQYSETGNIGYTRHLHTQDTRQRQTNWQHWVYKTPPYTRQRQTKKNKKQSTIWVRYHNAQTNTASVNKT